MWYRGFAFKRPTRPNEELVVRNLQAIIVLRLTRSYARIAKQRFLKTRESVAVAARKSCTE